MKKWLSILFSFYIVTTDVSFDPTNPSTMLVTYEIHSINDGTLEDILIKRSFFNPGVPEADKLDQTQTINQMKGSIISTLGGILKQALTIERDRAVIQQQLIGIRVDSGDIQVK